MLSLITCCRSTDANGHLTAQPMTASLLLPGLWQGSAFDMDDEGWWASAHFTHPVSACTVPCRKPGVRVLHIGLKDHDDANLTRHIGRVARFIHTARLSGGVVFLHCSQGVSRSSALTTAYVMAACGTNCDTSLHYISCKRDACFPNLGFYRQLVSFEACGGVDGLSKELQSMDGSSALRAADCEAVSLVLQSSDHDVDVTGFREWFENKMAGRLWSDQMVARVPMEVQVSEGACCQQVVNVEEGARILVLKRGEQVDGPGWEGEFNGKVGVFDRSCVRELDCAESEDEDEYQGGLGTDWTIIEPL